MRSTVRDFVRKVYVTRVGSSTSPHTVPAQASNFPGGAASLIQNPSPNLRPASQDPEGWQLQTSFSPSSLIRENPVCLINSWPQMFSSPFCLYHSAQQLCVGGPSESPGVTLLQHRHFLASHLLKSLNLCTSPSSSMNMETNSTYCEEGCED